MEETMITEQQPGISTRVELYEMLELIDKSDEPAELVSKFGKQYSSFTDYLRGVFDERIQWLLPDGKPPYRPADPAVVPSSWHKQHMNLKYFIKVGVSDSVSQTRRERMFIDMLESIHPEDALIVCKMVEKKTTSKKLTKDLVKEVFPNLCE
jgi:hypothetical protein